MLHVLCSVRVPITRYAYHGSFWSLARSGAVIGRMAPRVQERIKLKGLESSQRGSSPLNLGQEVDQIRGKIQILGDFEGTLGVSPALSPFNFLAKIRCTYDNNDALRGVTTCTDGAFVAKLVGQTTRLEISSLHDTQL